MASANELRGPAARRDVRLVGTAGNSRKYCTASNIGKHVFYRRKAAGLYPLHLNLEGYIF